MEPGETPLVGFWDRPQGELLGTLQATAAGLTSDEAKKRLRLHGPEQPDSGAPLRAPHELSPLLH